MGDLSEINESITDVGVTMWDHDSVSPVTLSTEWSRVARLLIMAGLSVIGSVGNGYMISAVIVEEHLSKRGNSFIANVALADLLISGLVIPASAVIILAGLEDCPPVCHMQWFLAVLCCLATVLTLTAIAAENYARLCLSPECYLKLTTTKITITIFTIWGLSALLVSLQLFYKLGPDYCAKKVKGVVPYQVIVAGLFVIIPILLTAFLYFRITRQVRIARSNPSFKPPLVFKWDYSLMQTNMYSFIMFIFFWLPFMIMLAISSVKVVSAQLFYKLAWLALSRSCFNNILYCVANRHFQNAYINLFHYCCCKTTVTFSRRTRGEGPARPTGDVRVHIIPGYNVYPYTSPQRCGEPNLTHIISNIQDVHSGYLFDRHFALDHLCPISNFCCSCSNLEDCSIFIRLKASVRKASFFQRKHPKNITTSEHISRVLTKMRCHIENDN